MKLQASLYLSAAALGFISVTGSAANMPAQSPTPAMIAELKASLHLRPYQEPIWNYWADAALAAAREPRQTDASATTNGGLLASQEIALRTFSRRAESSVYRAKVLTSDLDPEQRTVFETFWAHHAPAYQRLGDTAEPLAEPRSD